MYNFAFRTSSFCGKQPLGRVVTGILPPEMTGLAESGDSGRPNMMECSANVSHDPTSQRLEIPTRLVVSCHPFGPPPTPALLGFGPVTEHTSCRTRAVCHWLGCRRATPIPNVGMAAGVVVLPPLLLFSSLPLLDWEWRACPPLMTPVMHTIIAGSNWCKPTRYSARQMACYLTFPPRARLQFLSWYAEAWRP